VAAGAPGSRRRARAYALQVLYALDVDAAAQAGLAAGSYWQQFELELDESSREFATHLVQGTRERLAELDDIIQSSSRNWRLDRMSRVDRNILRMGAYELKNCPETPARVVLNEAVELAKRFGAEESAAFVNGILDRIAQRLERKEEPP
jgi:N utilization substance protein B